MEDTIKIAILYAAGALVLFAELFVPSSGVLLILGLGLFGWGLYEAFMLSWGFGVMNAIMLMIVLPTGIILGIRNWHRTPIGRRMSPPNPELTEADRLPVHTVLGTIGQSVTVLRPVGTCEFAGKRLECMAESGFIERGVKVEAIGLSDRTVLVRAVDSQVQTL